MAARRSRLSRKPSPRNPGGSPAEPFHVLGPASPDSDQASDDGRINEEILDRAARRRARKAPAQPRQGGTRRRG